MLRALLLLTATASVQDRPETVADLMARAFERNASGAFAEAEALSTRVLERHPRHLERVPGDAEALFTRGRLHSELQDHEAALADLDKAAAALPRSAPLRAWRGVVLEHLDGRGRQTIRLTGQ